MCTIHIFYSWISASQSSGKNDGFGLGILVLKSVIGMRALELNEAVNQKEGYTTTQHY